MTDDNGNHAHTPGPWNIDIDEYGDEIWLGGKGCGTFTIQPEADDLYCIAWLGGLGVDDPTTIGNARLIAAGQCYRQSNS